MRTLLIACVLTTAMSVSAAGQEKDLMVAVMEDENGIKGLRQQLVPTKNCMVLKAALLRAMKEKVAMRLPFSDP